MRLRFISDVATPHVNAILSELSARQGLQLDLWYADETYPGYPVWKNNPTHLVQRANLFGGRQVNAGLVAGSLIQRRQGLAIVGWSTPTTRLLLPLLDLAARNFIFFSDEPVPSKRGVLKKVIRNQYVGALRRRALVLATGRNAVRHFVGEGVPAERVLNAPVPTLVPRNLDLLRAQRADIRARYDVPPDVLLVIAGSRLIPAKGFDILLRAMAALTSAERSRLRVVVVGSGSEEQALKKLSSEADLNSTVRFESWLELSDFEALFAAADLAVHPARFDGYGATSLMGVAMGLPVIGTHAAGSAAELIETGVNGFLYDAEDVLALVRHFRTFLERPELAKQMGEASTRLAPKWSPARVADVFVSALRRLES